MQQMKNQGNLLMAGFLLLLGFAILFGQGARATEETYPVDVETRAIYDFGQPLGNLMGSPDVRRFGPVSDEEAKRMGGYSAFEKRMGGYGGLGLKKRMGGYSNFEKRMTGFGGMAKRMGGYSILKRMAGYQI
ncbi:uncharacterized protein LOC142345507 [Convolutriloba macropyga]|uniref:uncharacterized protein LOC142345507 n=1 Tax=Convolutriloba macropyga TaxID=536237 RepID=UPI003F51BF18